ncbi:MAG: helix-turn-helix domain-containing protein [Candidatus Marsarchaeota archaeon]|nr:helix-turn-helix domain-containing protein [Candidatus Marsarchaeota archaeon]
MVRILQDSRHYENTSICAVPDPSLGRTERTHLEAGLRSSDAFVLRRCQIILASSRKQRIPWIALSLGCNNQTVLNAINAFHREGLDSLQRKSSRPHLIHSKFKPGSMEQLPMLLHQSPRSFGKPASLWTLELIAEVSFAQELTSEKVTIEAIRLALKRLGLNWKRAKGWITSPDPQYARKKGRATA